jgi:signal transduction histidine kinase
VPEGNGGHPASAALPDGRIGFATVQGLIVMDPGRHRPDVPPLVLLDSVSGAESTSGASDHFIAPPGGGPLVFGFTAPSIGAPGSVRVRFRLRGRDRDWVEAGLEGRAVYSDLAPGDYALDLSARLADGPWSNPVTAATVVARPFWWQTAAARGLALVVLVLGLAGAVHLRLRAAERRNRELAREIRDRVTAEQEAHRHLLALARVGRLATAGELAASLAHELGQPLTAIAANAEAAAMLLASPARDPDRIAGIVGSIGRDGRRAAEVVRGLRTFLKRGEPEFAPLDVNHAVREVMTLLESTLASARVRLHLELADGLPPVPGDRVPLQLVVLNLTLNAVEALRGHESERRCVMVRTRRLNGHVRVSVLDSGPGLPAGQPQRLFEPFHTTKRGGMGMGLAISRSIVEAHGGHIGARNRGGAGAVFSFTLPVQRSDSRR